MIDPFTSLSLACSIVQLVDFSSKLLSKGAELYKSTALSEYIELEKIASDLHCMTENLLIEPNNPTQQISDDEEQLKDLAARSRLLSEELIVILKDLKVGSTHQKWQSFRQALRSVRKKEKIQALEKTLESLQMDINTRLLNIMRSVEINRQASQAVLCS